MSKDSFNLLKRLSKNPALSNFHLVGGTALALLLGHRETINIDLFSTQKFKKDLITKLKEKYQIISLMDSSIELMINDTKVFFYASPLKLYRPANIIEGITFCDPIDIGLMKLLSLIERPTKKDLIDLYFIDKKVIGIEELLKILQDEYNINNFDNVSVVNSIFNNEYLVTQPLPVMYEDFEWKDCYEDMHSKLLENCK